LDRSAPAEGLAALVIALNTEEIVVGVENATLNAGAVAQNGVRHHQDRGDLPGSYFVDGLLTMRK
jgi:hypothetical protein